MILPLKSIAGGEAGKFKSSARRVAGTYLLPGSLPGTPLAFAWSRCYTRASPERTTTRGGARAAFGFNYQNNMGASMLYIIQILGAILIGTAIGSLLGPRNNALFVG